MGCLFSREKTTDSREVVRVDSERRPYCNGMTSTEFTEEQKHLVKTTWNIVREDISKVGVITFLRFVTNC